MHNHALSKKHEIMPYPIKYRQRPKFLTPNFDEFKEIPAPDTNSLKTKGKKFKGIQILSVPNDSWKGFRNQADNGEPHKKQGHYFLICMQLQLQ